MVRSAFLSLLTALFIAGTIPAVGQSPQVLRVLTYNIHHGEGTDGKLDLERIAEVIKTANPDLVALQEVDRNAQRTGNVDQLARIAELTGLHSTYGKAMDFQGGAYGVAILSRWPLQEPLTHPLPSPEAVEPRVVLEATVAPAKDGPKIRFLVTHVDHKREPAHRTAQVSRIRELFPVNGTDAAPAILAGDLNATPGSEVIKSLLADWTDSAAGQNFFTSPATSPRSKIDYVLYRPAAGWRVVETRALEAQVASDHLPVLAVLEQK